MKVLIKGSEQEPLEVAVELSSNKDYYFGYRHCSDIIGFSDQKEC